MHPRNVRLIRRLASKGMSVEKIAVEIEEHHVWQWHGNLPTSDQIAKICNEHAILIAEMRKVYKPLSEPSFSGARSADIVPISDDAKTL